MDSFFRPDCRFVFIFSPFNFSQFFYKGGTIASRGIRILCGNANALKNSEKQMKVVVEIDEAKNDSTT
jgi:hypothetical protein